MGIDRALAKETSSVLGSKDQQQQQLGTASLQLVYIGLSKPEDAGLGFCFSEKPLKGLVTCAFRMLDLQDLGRPSSHSHIQFLFSGFITTVLTGG